MGMTKEEWRLLQSLYETKENTALSDSGQRKLNQLVIKSLSADKHPEWYSHKCFCIACDNYGY